MLARFFTRKRNSKKRSPAVAMVESLERRLNLSPIGTGWELQFADEFNGAALDANTWTVDSGARKGATNTPNAVKVADGNLTITTFTYNGRQYTGFIGSKNKFAATYGYWEARVKFNDAPGMWSAFWLQSPTIGTPLGDTNTAGTEIDIVEHRRVGPDGADISNKSVTNLHWDGYAANHKSTGSGLVNNPTTTPLQGNFHLYAVQWDSTGYKFYIDDKQVWQTSTALSKRSEFIYLSSEVLGNDWAGNIPAQGYGSLSTSTTKMQVDYVRVYQKPVSDIANVSIANKPITIPFTVMQRDGVTTSVTAKSSNGALIPAANLVVNGTGANRTLTITPTGNVGTSTITVIASNGTISGVDTFVVTKKDAGSFHNSGFEDSPLGTGWKLTGSAAVSTVNPRSGKLAMRMDGQSGVAEQVVTGLKANTSYTLSGWARVSDVSVIARLGAKNYGRTSVSKTASNLGYVFLSMTFKTGLNTTQATIYLSKSTTSHAAYFDDLTLIPTPV